MNYALEIQNLHKVFGKVEAIKSVSFSVDKGEIFGLLGPNGAGKTTIINIITGLGLADSGAVKIFGHDVVHETLEAKKLLGIVPQEIINSGFFDVEEILKFHSGYYGIRNNKERIEYVLHKLSLFEHRKKKVKQLSGGMKRRLMIAKALIHNPKLLLLDEPTAGVDIGLRESLWEYVRELQNDGMSILLTTHYLEEAEMLCQRVGIINRGQVECIGKTSEIVKDFTQKCIFLKLKNKPSINSKYLISQDANEYKFIIPTDYSLGLLLSELEISTSQLIDARIEEGSLEDAFMRVLGAR